MSVYLSDRINTANISEELRISPKGKSFYLYSALTQRANKYINIPYLGTMFDDSKGWKMLEACSRLCRAPGERCGCWRCSRSTNHFSSVPPFLRSHFSQVPVGLFRCTNICHLYRYCYHPLPAYVGDTAGYSNDLAWTWLR